MEFLSIWDIVLTPVYLTIIFLFANRIKQKNRLRHPEYNFYTWGLLAKVFGAISVCVIYTVYYDGGDTTAYFKSAVALGKLLFKSPSAYLSIFFGNISLEYSIQGDDWGSDPHTVYGTINISSLGIPISWITLDSYEGVLNGGDTDTLKSIENVIGAIKNNTIIGDDQDNILEGNIGNDYIDGKGGDDTIKGHEGADTLLGSDGDDLVYGGDGDDTLSGGTGNDTLLGEANDDTLEGGAGDDIIDGGAGVDTVTFINSEDDITINLRNTNQQDTGTGLDIIKDIENVTGSLHNDTIEGDSKDNILDGGVGTDTVSFSHAQNGVSVSLAVDTQQDTHDGMDTIKNFENLIGSEFADNLTGDDDQNAIYGLSGDDTLDGGKGSDTLYGGSDNDIFISKDDDGSDTIDGGDGNNDTIDYSATTKSIDITLNQSNNATVTIDDGDNDTVKNIENVIGSTASDTISGDIFNNSLYFSKKILSGKP